MHKIVTASYGFRITVSGPMDSAEAEQLKSKLLRALSSHNQPFSLIVDLREMVATEPGVLEVIEDTQKACKFMSLVRTALLVSSPVLKAQILQTGFSSGTAEADRFIDTSKADNWEEQALAWVVNAVEPSCCLKPALDI